MTPYVNMDSSSDVTPQGHRLIYFSSVTYASYAQRPHFMAAAFADDGFDSVLWVDPDPTRLPTIADCVRDDGSPIRKLGNHHVIGPCPVETRRRASATAAS